MVVDALPVGRFPPRLDLSMIAGFIRPWVLWRGLFVGRPFLSRRSSAVMITVKGLMVEPLAWLHSLSIRRQPAASVRNSLIVAIEPLAEQRLLELLGV